MMSFISRFSFKRGNIAGKNGSGPLSAVNSKTKALQPKVYALSEEAELRGLEEIRAEVLRGLRDAPLDDAHYLHDVARVMREEIRKSNAVSMTHANRKSATIKILDDLSAILATRGADCVEQKASQGVFRMEGDTTRHREVLSDTKLRLSFFKHYIASLRSAVDEADTPLLQSEEAHLDPERLVGVVLLGSASERINEHLQMCRNRATEHTSGGHLKKKKVSDVDAPADEKKDAPADLAGLTEIGSLNQLELQTNFYTLYEPEVATATEWITSRPIAFDDPKKIASSSVQGVKTDSSNTDGTTATIAEPEESVPTVVLGSDKKRSKALSKLGKNFLLDTLEINTKSRSVFCWSVPGFHGFKPVDTDSALSIRTLAIGRRRFFPEGDAVGEALVNEYVRHRKEMIERRKERNRLLKNGAMFFVATFLVDFYISTL